MQPHLCQGRLSECPGGGLEELDQRQGLEAECYTGLRRLPRPGRERPRRATNRPRGCHVGRAGCVRPGCKSGSLSGHRNWVLEEGNLGEQGAVRFDNMTLLG